MRILKVVTRLVRGGAQGTMIAMARELARRGHDVTCLYGPPDRGEGSYETELAALAPLGVRGVMIPALVRDPDPLRDVRALAAVCSEAARGRHDVIHTYTSKAGWLGRLAGRLAGVPAVVHSAQGHVFARGANIPGVSESAAKRRLFLAMERKAARWADALVALTPEEASEQEALGIGAGRFAVIPNPVEERFFAVPPAPEKDGRRAVVVGRLAAEKGQRFLLEALCRARAHGIPVALDIVGDGPDRAGLEAFTREKGISDAVRFLGLREDVAPALARADFLVLPSAYEAQGIVLLEAMAAGLPVVATRVGGVPRFVTDGVEGFLVPYGDAGALAAVMSRLASDAELRARFAVAGRRRAEAYRPARIAAELDALYRRASRG